MSMSYWICQGIGIRTNELIPFLSMQKCIQFIKVQLPDEDIVEDEFDLDNYLCGNPFDNLGYIFCHCDDTGSLTYDDNGDGESYFYYPPSYPWRRRSNEPENICEVHKRIIDAVLCLCDMRREQIDALIDDDIYDVGCG